MRRKYAISLSIFCRLIGYAGAMLLFLLPVATTLAQPGESALEGYWRNPSGSVIISIAPCGEAMCGRVQWASDKAVADARKGGTDPLVGVELLSGFVPKGENRWKGRLFVPDLKRTSKAVNGGRIPGQRGGVKARQ